MAGDFSRNSFNRWKHYTGVLMQQGRVQVDADWNEQLALQLHRTYAETGDIIGRCGTPKSGSGFFISELEGGGDLLIHPGHFYVNGLLCELEPECVPASFPSDAGISPLPANVVYHMSSGQSLAGAMREIDLMRANFEVPGVKFVSGDGQVNIPSLCMDGRNLAVNDWVKISANGSAPVTAMVTEISANTPDSDPNAITPSYYTVTVNRSLAKLAAAGSSWLQRAVTFTTQPFLEDQWDVALETLPLSGPGGATLTLPDGDYLVVLDAWLREVNALEDPHIREVALGGPDTCERLQTVWQVHVVPYGGEVSPPNSPLSSPLASPPSSPLDCCSDFPGWDEYKAAVCTTGLMNALAPPAGNNVPQCQLPPAAGYLGLANQLYRVEVFQSGNYNDAATIVWSRDNAMVETPIVCIDAMGFVYVSDLGKDDLHSFGQNDWVEIVDDAADLLGEPRFLAQISQTPGTAAQPPCAATGTQAYMLTLTPPAPSRFQNRSNLRLRRWDMPQSPSMLLDGNGNPLGTPIVPGWIPLENNIQVNFTDGFYATRSYWEIPARTATGDIEWPPFQVPNTNPIPQPPHGGEHSFCRLAIITVTGGDWKITDCRCTFPSLTNICASDICYHGSECEFEAATTVQQALDELDAKHRYHNKMLHGTGVVCGLAVRCPGGNLTETSVQIDAGYAIDCDGYDLIVDQATSVDLNNLVALSPQETTIPDGDYELLVERAAEGVFARSIISSEVQKAGSEESNSTGGEACCSNAASSGSAPNACVTFRAIPCATQTFASEVMDGTLLMDFYTTCIKPIVDDFTKSYLSVYLSPSHQVTKAQALISSLTNLLIQLVEPSLTSDVYISPREAELLEEFYDWVNRRLDDSTCCNLSATLPAYPAYTPGSAAQMDTIFGKGFKTRMRIGPRGEAAYTVGVNADIHVYDLTTGKLTYDITPPIPGDASGWTVQDIAFSSNGEELYVIATGVNTTTNSSDSLFAVGSIQNGSVTWPTSGSAGALPFSSLATSKDGVNAVFATVQGQGLWSISFGNGVAPKQLNQFNAIGHLVAFENYLYATASDSQSASTFDEVLRFEAVAQTSTPIVFELKGMAGDLTDDIAVGNFDLDSKVTPLLAVTAATSSSTDKQLFVFPFNDAGANQIPSLDLTENTTTRLAFHPDRSSLMITFEDTCRIGQITFAPNSGLTLNAYAPTELNPTSAAFAQDAAGASHFYVLNSTANTISTMSASMSPFSADAALESYRVAALDAFIELAGAFLQNLKDCFCNLLLPECPSCNTAGDEGKGVALACITICGGSVCKICNLEKRKYVKTFPTVGYWLSLVPVIPLVKVLVEKFCCLDLLSIFNRLSTPINKAAFGPRSSTLTNMAVSGTNISGETMRYALNKVTSINFSGLPSLVAQQAKPVNKMVLDTALNSFQPKSAAAAPQIQQVRGMSLDQATSTLSAANINVAATQSYDPSALAQNLTSYAIAPAAVPPGSSVTMVVDSSNTVRYYVPTPPAVEQIGATVQSNQTEVETQVTAVNQANQQLQDRVSAVEKVATPALTDVQSLQTLVTSLQTQITTMQTTQAQELAARDQQIAQLTTTTQQMQTKLGKLDDLANEVKEIENRLPPPEFE